MAAATPATDLVNRYDAVVQTLRDAFGGRLKTVVLFGSQARGEARAESDHDLLLVVEGLPADPVRRQREVRSPLLPILHETPGSIAFTAKTPEELDANLTPLLLDVCADGVCLLGADFFEPYRARALAAIQQAGMLREDLGGHRMWTLPGGPSATWELTWDGYRDRG
jgi:predicted nucleotidyltransferase